MRAPFTLWAALIAMVALCVPPPALAQTALSNAQERALKAGDVFKECAQCPAMVAIPAGAFLMGSPDTEPDRDGTEGPQHRVTIARPFTLGKFELTVEEFAAFADETGYDTGNVCDLWQDGTFDERPGYNWRKPNFAQTGAHPAPCLSWDDAKAYLAWLSGKTGKAYRLPTEAEWEYAARAGSATRFHFGDDDANYCRYGNGVDAAALADVPGAREKGWSALPCRDGFAFTAPVGSFAPNAFGLHDTHGNVFEWVEDCWNGNFHQAPADGSAWLNGDCKIRVQRGGAWGYPRSYLRIAVRGRQGQAYRYINAGVRVAREILR
jgi:formylglycine-generating enzyme required for sulfatase activity